MRNYFFIVLLFILLGCNNATDSKTAADYKTTGSIERIDASLDSIIGTGAKIEIIAEGFEWSEGPLWVESQKMLLFSDVPRDTVYKWTEAKGKEVFVTPSGYSPDSAKRSGEMGSNGLLLDKTGNLVLCQDGYRRLARMDAPMDKPSARYTSIAGHYEGKRFNSPNDGVFDSKGDILFTDPPYGLEKYMDDPKKETPFQGVYRIKASGEVKLLVDSITRPNGIGLLPGEKQLIVANSDPDKPYWYLFNVVDDSLEAAGIFHDPSAAAKNERGLPDGFKVDSKGNVFASGPGGVWIFNSKGKILGKIKLKEAASNTALSADEKTLYITNDMQVLRVKMR